MSGGRAFNASEQAVLRNAANARLATAAELARLESLGLIAVHHMHGQEGFEGQGYEVTEKGWQLRNLE